MERKRILEVVTPVIVVSVLAAVLVMTGCAPKPAPLEVAPPEVAEEVPTYKWRLQSVCTAGTMDLYCTPWVDNVEKMSGGRIEIDMYSSAELVPDERSMVALREGTIDVIQYCSAFGPGVDVRDIENFLAGGWVNNIEGQMLMDRGLNEIIEEAYHEYGVEYLGPWSNCRMVLISNRPIRTYEDLEGLRISTVPAFADPFEGTGATIMSIPAEEIFMSGETGVIDAVYWGAAGEYVRYGWNEVFPYVLNDVFGVVRCNWVMNQDVWNSLPEDLKTIVNVATRDNSWLVAGVMYEDAFTGLEQYKEVTHLSPEDYAKTMENCRAKWDERAAVSPRCAEYIRIVKEFNEEIEATGFR